MPRNNPAQVSQVFKKEKRLIRTFPKGLEGIKHRTTRRLIPFAVENALRKSRMSANKQELVECLLGALEEKHLGEILLLSMNGKLDSFFEKATLTFHEEELLMEVNFIDDILGERKKTQIFLSRLGNELLNFYSREQNQNH